MPDFLKRKPSPDIEGFIKTIRGEIVPNRPPLVELIIDHPVIREVCKTYLGHDWVEPSPDKQALSAYWKNRIDFSYRMGYDYVRVDGGLDFPLKTRLADDTAELSHGQRGWMEEGTGMISTWSDFEQYDWPDPNESDLWHYEFVASNLPEGMGLFVCPTSGFLEIPLDFLFGYENLCYLMYDNPKLVEAVFEKVGGIITRFYERVLGLPNLRGFFQGDDMGYKTSTMISAEQLRVLSLPWHKKLAQLAHDNGLIYMLHTCGHLDEIMDELIDDVHIDARHSFEDEGNSVIDFKRDFGSRVTALGGVDVHKLATLSEPDMRSWVRQIIDVCLPGGRFAIGSGNTVCNYVPVGNYLAMIDEALSYA